MIRPTINCAKRPVPWAVPAAVISTKAMLSGDHLYQQKDDAY